MDGEKKKEIFISYLDDDDAIISRFVDSIKFKGQFIRFSLGNSLIIIPSSRVLKVKGVEL